MKEIELTQGKTALVDDADYGWLNQYSWQARIHKGHTVWYAQRTTGKPAHAIQMHRAILDAPKSMLVDHIDCNGLNNQRANLRLATASQNLQNRPKYKNNTSGYKGVTWLRENNKWQAEIRINNQHVYIGSFTNVIDAARAYDAVALANFGEFALLNFPTSGR